MKGRISEGRSRDLRTNTGRMRGFSLVRRSIALGSAAAILLLSTHLLFARSPNEIWLPHLENRLGQVESSILVVSTASGLGPVVVDFFDRQGGPPTTVTRPFLPAHFHLPGMPELATEGSFAVTVSADPPIAAIAGTTWRDTGANIMTADAEASEDLLLPLALRDYHGWTTVVSVQNTDTSSEATATFEFRSAGTEAVLARWEQGIPPGAVTIDLGELPERDIPAGSRGSLRVSSETTRLAMVAYGRNPDRPKMVYGYEGIPSHRASSRLFAPLVRNDFFGTTGIVLANPGLEPVTVTLRYRMAEFARAACAESGAHGDGAVRIAGGGSAVFYQGGATPETGDPHFEPGCYGVAVVDVEGGKVVGSVVDFDVERGRAAAYNAFSMADAAKRVLLPVFMDRYGSSQLTTGIQVMNLGDASTEVRIRVQPDVELDFYCWDGCPLKLPPLASGTWYPPNLDFGRVHSFSGSAELSSTEPIVGIVYGTSIIPSHWDATIYAGIGVQE